MPRRRRKMTKRRPKRRFKRKMLSVTTALPEVANVKLVYTDVIKINGSAGFQVAHIFRCNSIFDPDQTGTGHQPYMHDQFAALYGKYRVKSSKITIAGTSTNFNHAITLGIARRTVSAASNVPGEENEIPETKYTHAGGEDVARVSMGFNAIRQFGRAADPGTTSALFGNNPAQEAFYVVYAYMNNPSAGVDIDVNVRIEYTLQLSEVAIQSRS